MSDDASKFGLPLSLRASGGTIQPYIEEGTTSPDGVLSRPRGSLYLRTTPAQLWQNTDGATAWTQIASGSMGAHFATDAFIYFGDADNYQIGYVSNIVPYLPGPPPVPPTPGWLISSTLVDDTPGPGLASAVSIGTQATLAQGVGVTGKISGYLAFSTGNTDADPGNTGGDVGGIAWIGGSALGTVNGAGGTSGNTQDWTFQMGDSDDGSGGSMKFILGSAATTLGDFEWRLGQYSTAGLTPGNYLFTGSVDPAVGGICSAAQLLNVSLVGYNVATNGNGQSAPLLVKVFTFGAGGGQSFTQKISLGSATAPPHVAQGYVVSVKVVKIGGAAIAGDVVNVVVGATTICSVPLVGLVANRGIEAGLGTQPFDPTVVMNNGDSIVTSTVAGGGGDCSCVVYLTYVQG